MVLIGKSLPANAKDLTDVGLIPESGRSPGRGHSSPLQYSYLENPTGRRAWWATVHRVTKSQTWLKWLGTKLNKVIRHISLLRYTLRTKRTAKKYWLLLSKFFVDCGTGTVFLEQICMYYKTENIKCILMLQRTCKVMI